MDNYSYKYKKYKNKYIQHKIGGMGDQNLPDPNFIEDLNRLIISINYTDIYHIPRQTRNNNYKPL